MEKTNVMRILEQKKINYNSYSYADTDAISGIEVASVLNQDPNRVFRTLVTIANTNNYYVFVIPVNKELDLKKAAKSVGVKSVSMIIFRTVSFQLSGLTAHNNVSNHFIYHRQSQF